MTLFICDPDQLGTLVGWALADNMRSELVVAALSQALGSTANVPGRIFHSDRGSQYGCKAIRKLLKKAGMLQSMSRRANPYDNAWTESMIGTLKTEMVRGGIFASEQDAHTELFAYLEGYYNTQRKHSSLGYQTPAQYEKCYYTNLEGELDVGGRGGRAPLLVAIGGGGSAKLPSISN